MRIETFCLPDTELSVRWIILVDSKVDASIEGSANEMMAVAKARGKYPYEVIITSLNPDHPLSNLHNRRDSFAATYVGTERRFSGVDKYIRQHGHMSLDYIVLRLKAKGYMPGEITAALRRYIDRL